MPTPWPQRSPDPHELAAFADAEPRPLWAAALPGSDAAPPLVGGQEADLCVVGAGFTGLWAALHAKRDEPHRDVVVLEAEVAGFAASGRNGGFLEASLTHGLFNGLSRFADEMVELERLGAENFRELKADLERLGVDCDYEPTGVLSISYSPYDQAEAAEEAEILRRFGYDVEVLASPEAVRAEIDSPLFRAGIWHKNASALVDPGKLAAGLRRAAVEHGVRLHEHSPVSAIEERGAALELMTPQGRLRARKVVLATNAYTSLHPAIRRRVVPVYDYVLVTEPLNAEQKRSIGWANRQGASDSANQFHYFRLTADDRILWGGYDAVYRFGGPIAPRLDDHAPTFGRLSQHFFTVFPQLRGLRFTHRWGGAIDTCSRFSVFFGTSHHGRLAYAAGYTGLGVGSARFGARVALDLVDGRDNPALRLKFVRRKPLPFPPEPLRAGIVQLTRNRLAAADENDGRRGLWLRTLDRLGLGFDS